MGQGLRPVRNQRVLQVEHDSSKRPETNRRKGSPQIRKGNAHFGNSNRSAIARTVFRASLATNRGSNFFHGPAV